MNIPSGRFPTDFPPVGISRVIEGVSPFLNCEFSFLDIDYFRPTFEEIEKTIISFNPQVIGFSAILTSAYAYLKELHSFIKRKFPHIIQVMGGEMVAMAEIIMQKTQIDFCVAGESEPTFSNLIARLQKDNFKIDKEDYKSIRGLVFSPGNSPFFTGYAEEIANIGQINWELLAKFTNINHYMQKIEGQYYTNRINRHEINNFLKLLYPQNTGKRIATLFASKGCVGKCTFCHRFFKGYKTENPDTVINYIEGITKKYNIGLVQFEEENFGSNFSKTLEIISYLKKKRLNWAAGAVRVKTVNEKVVKIWKDTGCVHVNFGVESCSQKMLDVMAKGTTVEENLNALKLLNKYKIFTVISLVLGMPGESESTVDETILNLSKVIPDDMNMPYEICINWFQAVPGTAGYEYARKTGLIGQSIDREEEYILGLYNMNANDIKHYLNFTDRHIEEIAYWEDYIFAELIAAYVKKHGIFNVWRHKAQRRYKYGVAYMLLPKVARKFMLKNYIIGRKFGWNKAFHSILRDFHPGWNPEPKRFKGINRSLREINGETDSPSESIANIHVLRKGR